MQKKVGSGQKKKGTWKLQIKVKLQDREQTPYGSQIRMQLELPQVHAGQRASKRDSKSLDPYRSAKELKHRQPFNQGTISS